jgi:low temperature requirement protein LtrA
LGRGAGIEYISPAVRFWIPKYGASSVADWVVEGGHMAERCAGFIIIALGESIVVTGATFAELAWTAETVARSCRPFIGSLAMWWIYFHKGAEAGSEQISNPASRAAGAAGLHLSAHADRGRHHSLGGRR